MNIKVCHLTTVHSRYDIRIFQKMCLTLINENFDVNLIVADGLGDEVKNGIKIFDIGKPKSRLHRIKNYGKKMFLKAYAIDADIYHFHDPELISCGLRLKNKQKVVIMDAHEDFPKQLLGKPYMNKFFRILLSKSFSIYERFATKKFSAVICATAAIGDKFKKFVSRVIIVNNYPITNELFSGGEYKMDNSNVCYIGAISEIRGIKEIVKSAEISKYIGKLKIAGRFNNEELYRVIQNHSGWQNVEEMGSLNREKVRELLSESAAGLVTFLPQENHIDAQPNKMFEYMSAGIPVIASHFPLWKEIIEGNNCGICVDPENPEEIAKAIDTLICDSNQARMMGENGRRAVQAKYNWSVEEPRLINLYRELSKKIR